MYTLDREAGDNWKNSKKDDTGTEVTFVAVDWDQNATMGHLHTRTIIMQEYCSSSHSNAVMYHFMHACELESDFVRPWAIKG